MANMLFGPPNSVASIDQKMRYPVDLRRLQRLGTTANTCNFVWIIAGDNAVPDQNKVKFRLQTFHSSSLDVHCNQPLVGTYPTYTTSFTGTWQSRYVAATMSDEITLKSITLEN